MSATLEGDVLSSYFGCYQGDKIVPAPVVVVAEKPYSVLEFYLDDITHLGHVRCCGWVCVWGGCMVYTDGCVWMYVM